MHAQLTKSNNEIRDLSQKYYLLVREQRYDRVVEFSVCELVQNCNTENSQSNKILCKILQLIMLALKLTSVLYPGGQDLYEEAGHFDRQLYEHFMSLQTHLFVTRHLLIDS